MGSTPMLFVIQKGSVPVEVTCLGLVMVWLCLVDKNVCVLLSIDWGQCIVPVQVVFTVAFTPVCVSVVVAVLFCASL